MARVTVASWEELCRFIRSHKGTNLKLKPISWTGERKVDRRTKAWSDDGQVEEVYSIIFEVDYDQ